MFERLNVDNIGGVAHAELRFSSHFIVITGESGAGKSSIVRAIELLGGRRSSADFIRAGENMALVDAVFSTDIPPAEEGNLFAKRTCSRAGRSIASLQDKPMPLSSYITTMERLLRIQSQFAQMELMDEANQLSMVDTCGGAALKSALNEMKRLFHRAKSEEKALQTLLEKQKKIENKFADAENILLLVKSGRPELNTESQLDGERKKLSDRLSAFSQAMQALAVFSDNLEGMEHACRKLSAAAEEGASVEIDEHANEGVSHLQEVARIASTQFGSALYSALNDEFETLEKRLGNIRKLKRMAGVPDEEALIAWCAEAESSIEWLKTAHDEITASRERVKEAKRNAARCAMQIRDIRKDTVTKLEARVNALLADLAMGSIRFSIRFTELPRLRENGADCVSFLLSTSKREGAVDKIASGGELSRILLALQLSLPDEWLPQTLVFDEVEAGLGGHSAVLSGEKLRDLSKRCQVILVTHEASIAALGTEHFVVEKDGENVNIRQVEGEERIGELARMLTGDSNLTEARQHAKRLLSFF